MPCSTVPTSRGAPSTENSRSHDHHEQNESNCVIAAHNCSAATGKPKVRWYSITHGERATTSR